MAPNEIHHLTVAVVQCTVNMLAIAAEDSCFLIQFNMTQCDPVFDAQFVR